MKRALAFAAVPLLAVAACSSDDAAIIETSPSTIQPTLPDTSTTVAADDSSDETVASDSEVEPDAETQATPAAEPEPSPSPAPTDPEPADDTTPEDSATNAGDAASEPATADDEAGAASEGLAAGRIEAGPDDLFVLGSDGDLDLVPGILGDAPGEPIVLVDNDDPNDPDAEGPGPNVVDEVVGPLDGAVVYSECCEPAAGAIFAVAEPGGERRSVASSDFPGISPDASLLAYANDFFITVMDTQTGETRAVESHAEEDADQLRSVRDVQWVSNDVIAVLSSSTANGYRFALYDAIDLTQIDVVGLNLADEGSDQYVAFAGLGPNGEIAVAEERFGSVTVRFLEPNLDGPDVELPGTVTSVELTNDGTGLLWVDGGTLFHLPAEGEKTELATDVLDAWPVSTG